jgi:hypothetical protein
MVDGFIQFIKETASEQKETRDETEKIRGELADIVKMAARHSDLGGDLDRFKKGLERKLEGFKVVAVDE